MITETANTLFDTCNSIKVNAEKQIAEIKSWLENLPCADGREYVLCVGFGERFNDAVDYANTLSLDAEGRINRVFPTTVPNLVTKHEAATIMRTARFSHEGKRTTPQYKLVPVSEWSKDALEILNDIVEDATEYLESDYTGLQPV